VKADNDRVGLKRLAHHVVHGLHYFSTLVSSGNVRLVGHHDHCKAGLADPLDRLRDSIQQFEIFQPRRGKRSSLANFSPVDDTVAIQENPWSGQTHESLPARASSSMAAKE
jgi:hypothetical protein